MFSQLMPAKIPLFRASAFIGGRRQQGPGPTDPGSLAAAGTPADYQFQAEPKSEQASVPESVGPGRSPLIGVLGAKGGCGSSTIAANLALAFSRGIAAPATLVDADFRQPDLNQILNLQVEHTIADLLAKGDDVDEQVLYACLNQVESSNCSLLTPPDDGSLALTANLSDLISAINRFRAQAGFWVADLPKHLDRHFVTFADSCDGILLVFEATVPSVAACQRWLRIFSELGYEEDRILCLLNRAGSKHCGVENQLSECFGAREIFKIPNASSLIWDCSTKGVAAVLAQPRHQYSRAIDSLADKLSRSLRS